MMVPQGLVKTNVGDGFHHFPAAGEFPTNLSLKK
jgi:hypothetical protein